jgi:hypothetical protein
MLDGKGGELGIGGQVAAGSESRDEIAQGEEGVGSNRGVSE